MLRAGMQALQATALLDLLLQEQACIAQVCRTDHVLQDVVHGVLCRP